MSSTIPTTKQLVNSSGFAIIVYISIIRPPIDQYRTFTSRPTLPAKYCSIIPSSAYFQTIAQSFIFVPIIIGPDVLNNSIRNNELLGLLSRSFNGYLKRLSRGEDDPSSLQRQDTEIDLADYAFD